MGKVWKKHWLLAKVAAEKEASAIAEPEAVAVGEVSQPAPQARVKVAEPQPEEECCDEPDCTEPEECSEPEAVKAPKPKAKAKSNRKPRAKSTKSK